MRFYSNLSSSQMCVSPPSASGVSFRRVIRYNPSLGLDGHATRVGLRHPTGVNPRFVSESVTAIPEYTPALPILTRRWSGQPNNQLGEARRLIGRLVNGNGDGSLPIRLFLGFDQPNGSARACWYTHSCRFATFQPHSQGSTRRLLFLCWRGPVKTYGPQCDHHTSSAYCRCNEQSMC